MATECSSMVKKWKKWKKIWNGNGQKYDKESFGPVETHFLDYEEMATQERKEQKDKVKASEGLIKIEYNRILEKAKWINEWMNEIYFTLKATIISHNF